MFRKSVGPNKMSLSLLFTENVQQALLRYFSFILADLCSLNNPVLRGAADARPDDAGVSFPSLPAGSSSWFFPASKNGLPRPT